LAWVAHKLVSLDNPAGTLHLPAEATNDCTLKPQVSFEILSDCPHQPLGMQLWDGKHSRFLVTTNFSGNHSPRPVAISFLPLLTEEAPVLAAMVACCVHMAFHKCTWEQLAWCGLFSLTQRPSLRPFSDPAAVAP
jgi:hypothetical protein